MTGLKTHATLPRRAAVPAPGPIVARGADDNGRTEQRQGLLAQAEALNASASQSAEQGDFETSARLILQALDCERRAGGLGPQVLQLIKPRG